MFTIYFVLLQITSEKDQTQYWHKKEMPYRFITVNEFSEKFKCSNIGNKLQEVVSEKYDNHHSNANVIPFSTNSTTKWELLRTCMAREYLLMKRNSFVHISKTAQVVI